VLAGESTFQLRARVELIMGSASTMRADRIARTEVARAQGYGDIQAWSQSGIVESKEWYTARDEHVCPFCNALDGKVFKLTESIFSKGDAFTVGDQKLDLSYDDVQSAPLHVSCRCALLPVRN
jgi:SPP1 gp7 family putative phage head morphogenesis protein